MKHKSNNYSLGVVCSGGGGVETGAIMSGSVSPTWSIDFDPNKPKLSTMVSDYNEMNTKTNIIRKPLQDVEESQLLPVDIIWGSLPCVSEAPLKEDRATAMKNVHGKGESSLDVDLANKFCNIVNAINPSVVILENVWGWNRFLSHALVLKHLEKHFEWVSSNVYSMDKYGVPQRRKRLIIRASNKPMRQIHETCRNHWYNAIESQLELLPETTLQPKVGNIIKDWDINWDIPFIVENSNYAFNKPKIADRSERLVWCLRASAGVDGKGNSRNKSIVVWIPYKRSFHALNSRCYALLSGFPDWYTMPDKPGHALYLCGIAVPPIFVKNCFYSLI